MSVPLFPMGLRLPDHRRDGGRLCGRHQRDRHRQFPFLPDGTQPGGGADGEDGGEDQGNDGEDGETKPKKRGGRRLAVECACQPPHKLHMTPKQIEDGPVICGLCRAPFEAPEDDETEEATETFHEIPDQS